MKDKTVCFSGHRKIPIEQYEIIRERLETAITSLIHQGYCYFGTGGAIGFDTLAAEMVLSLRNHYPQIRLILVLPCKAQAAKWHEHDRIIYNSILKKANKIVFVSHEYSRECMHKRNRHLVIHSSVCVCYLTKSEGGTAYTVHYAQKKGLQIINIA